jgi:hypothetical protein
MAWSFSAERVRELVAAPKCVAPGQKSEFASQGEGKEISVLLELIDGGSYHLRLIITAGRIDKRESYAAALLLNNRRVRGIDHNKIERRKNYRMHIPKGWHENVIDYTAPAADQNRHDALPGFAATDLQDFLRQICQRWNIQIEFGETLW